MRSPAARRRPASAAGTTCCSSPTGRLRSQPRSSGRGPATSSCSPGKGHEHSIIGPDGPVAYDERRTALAALADLGYDAARA